MPRVLLNFQHYGNAWTVHFIEGDCRTRIGPWTRYYRFADLDSFRNFVTRCQPEDATLDGFDHSVRAWGRGREYVHLMSEQYGKLQVRGEALRAPRTVYSAIQRHCLSFNLRLTD